MGAAAYRITGPLDEFMAIPDDEGFVLGDEASELMIQRHA